MQVLECHEYFSCVETSNLLIEGLVRLRLLCRFWEFCRSPLRPCTPGWRQGTVFRWRSNRPWPRIHPKVFRKCSFLSSEFPSRSPNSDYSNSQSALKRKCPKLTSSSPYTLLRRLLGPVAWWSQSHSDIPSGLFLVLLKLSSHLNQNSTLSQQTALTSLLQDVLKKDPAL